jgi:hypothetical protein
MGVEPQDARGIVEPDLVQELHRLLANGLPVGKMAQRLAKLALNAQGRVEIGQRILKHHRQAAMAAQRSYDVGRHRQYVFAAETNRARQLGDLHVRQ